MNKLLLFVKYVWDIWTIGDKTESPVDIAFDRFLTDVNAGTSTETTSNWPDYDFDAVKAEYDELTGEEKDKAIEIYQKFAQDNYDEICALFNAGDKAGCDALVEEFIKNYK